uniref:Hypothetical secreted peptide n=1 Tax=Glossina morsitans morsitans TaxID=37546 RepID=D3TSH3_GLOMM
MNPLLRRNLFWFVTNLLCVLFQQITKAANDSLFFMYNVIIKILKVPFNYQIRTDLAAYKILKERD